MELGETLVEVTFVYVPELERGANCSDGWSWDVAYGCKVALCNDDDARCDQ